MHWKNTATKVLPALLTIVLLAGACEKTNFTTRPQLTLESVSDTVIRNGMLLTFSFKVSDKEGDFNSKDDDTASLYYQKISISCSRRDVPTRNILPVNPELRKNFESNVDINLLYTTRQIEPSAGISVLQATGCAPVGRPIGNDTCYFRFWVKDMAGNTSDTVQSGRLVLVKP